MLGSRLPDTPRLPGTGRLPRLPIFGNGGFALPFALLTLVGVSLLVSTGFLLAWLDGRSARAFSDSTRAFYLAEAGLATALDTATGPVPALASLRLATGTANVTFERLHQLSAGEAVFRIEAEGAVGQMGDSLRRSVGRLVWIADPPRPRAALIAVGGITSAGASGRISGFDPTAGCAPVGGSPAGASPAVAGLMQWTGAVPPPGGPLAISGLPPLRIVPSNASLAAETGLRWTELLATFGPTPDAVIPPNPWPTGGSTPTSFVLLRGPVVLGAARSGSGALVVDGDLTLGTGFQWRGAVLVGGVLRLNGDILIRGAMLTGLAGLGGVSVDLGPHRIDLQFDSCAYLQAARRLTARAAAIPGTWYEVW